MSLTRLLIVETEPVVVSRWCLELGTEGFEPVLAGSGRDALARLAREPFQAMVLSAELGDLDAREVLAAARRLQPDLAIVAVSAQASVERAVEFVRLGAADFVVHPVAATEIACALRRAQQVPQSPPRASTGRLLGSSQAMRNLRALLEQVADTDCTVLVEGESGTGKELVARALHEASARRHGPFVAINCAAIPENLLESELFGHVKGAFTGATQARVGRFEAAHGGTLFLDEIGDMPLVLQVKLLRVLQERLIEPVGATRPTRVDVRIIAATHRNLERLVREGRFREDLYYRLHVIPISVPPLREHPEDISELCTSFLARVNRERGKAIRAITPRALAALERYPWPGNVRELENLMERMVVTLRGGTIDLEDLPPRYRGLTIVTTEREALLGPELPEQGVNLRETLAQVESRLISQALRRAGGNKNRAATLLGLNRTTLVEKLKRLPELAA
jgi:DNA-binding NtrC family response regulator